MYFCPTISEKENKGLYSQHFFLCDLQNSPISLSFPLHSGKACYSSLLDKFVSYDKNKVLIRPVVISFLMIIRGAGAV
jgi:hypothetical protein